MAGIGSKEGQRVAATWAKGSLEKNRCEKELLESTSGRQLTKACDTLRHYKDMKTYENEDIRLPRLHHSVNCVISLHASLFHSCTPFAMSFGNRFGFICFSI